MTILFEEEVESPFDFSWKDVATSVIHQAISYEKFPYEAEVDVTLTDDASIRQLNRTYRQIDAATDVLSFPLVDYDTPGDFSKIKDHFEYYNLETNAVLLGDIIISKEHVLAQAKEYGHSAKREFAFLVAHSMLHLFGYDHIEEAEMLQMEQKQKEILEQLHITREEV